MRTPKTSPMIGIGRMGPVTLELPGVKYEIQWSSDV